MNLSESMASEALRTASFQTERKVNSLSAKEVATKVIRASNERAAWLKNNVTSQTFVLAEIPLASVAVVERNVSFEIQASVAGIPIVVDINKKKVGRTLGKNSFVPKVIVIEGAGRHAAARYSGAPKIQAWVGSEAAKLLGIQAADTQFGTNELSNKISEKLRDKLVKKKSNKMDTMGPYPYLTEVYPFENYFVYSYDGDLYKQKFTCDLKKREISFEGNPESVVAKYVDVDAGQTNMEKTIRMIQNPSPGSGSGPRVTLPPPKGSDVGKK